MKKILLLLTAVFLSVFVIAQTSGGPDAYGYTWKNNSHTVTPPAYSWFDISTIGNEVIGLDDDNSVGPFYLQDTFWYYWTPVTKFWIGSNGYISFSKVNIASPFPASIPLSTGANNYIAAMAADLVFPASVPTAKCKYLETNDSIIISWLNVPLWSSTGGYTGSNTFQIILNKADKSITFNYQAINSGSVSAPDVTCGIENNTGSIGLACKIDAFPSSLSTYKFYYPSSVSYQAIDAGVNWNTNENSEAIFIKKSGPPMNLVTNIKNFGNQNLPAFSANNTVVNSSNVSITNGNITVPALAVLGDTSLTFTNTFVAPNVGTYRYRTTTTLSNDIVSFNNSLQQEIIAIDTTQTNMYLDYSDGTIEGSGLGWDGGNGGVGIYIEPPVYPAKIINSKFYISANGSSVGYCAKIYDDDGPNGKPGTLLDSVYVNPASISIGTYNTVNTVNNIIINNGGVYLLWYMMGNGINIGRDTNAPFSYRVYEYMNNSWSEYRDKYTEEFLMGITVQKYIPPLAPIADFSSNTTNDPVISFTDLTQNVPTSWLWNFGDNSTSTVQNPTHTYINNGTFNVCLKATNPTSYDTICKSVTISHVLPLANFTFNTALTPTISFTDNSIGSPTAWKWNFNDSGNDSSDIQNPSYTFKSNGLHNVCLTVFNQAGASVPSCKTVNVTGVGIEETKIDKLMTVYPNPADKYAIILLPASTKSNQITLSLQNILGVKLDINYILKNNKIEIDCSQLASGTYIFNVYQEDKKIGLGKFVVK